MQKQFAVVVLLALASNSWCYDVSPAQDAAVNPASKSVKERAKEVVQSAKARGAQAAQSVKAAAAKAKAKLTGKNKQAAQAIAASDVSQQAEREWSDYTDEEKEGLVFPRFDEEQPAQTMVVEQETAQLMDPDKMQPAILVIPSQPDAVPVQAGTPPPPPPLPTATPKSKSKTVAIQLQKPQPVMQDQGGDNLMGEIRTGVALRSAQTRELGPKAETKRSPQEALQAEIAAKMEKRRQATQGTQVPTQSAQEAAADDDWK